MYRYKTGSTTLNGISRCKYHEKNKKMGPKLDLDTRGLIFLETQLNRKNNRNNEDRSSFGHTSQESIAQGNKKI